MTLRTNTSTLAASTVTISNLHIGQKVDGEIKRIEDYGLFIQIQNSKLTGLCHKSQVRHDYSLRFF
jgi:rRNA biogenesis protein RRP5